MGAFTAYSLPIQGLKNELHAYRYHLNSEFFGHFEDSPIADAGIEVGLQLDKRHDLMVFDFDLRGWVAAECDRCTAQIRLPLEAQEQLMVKYGEPEEDDDEVVFIPREASEFNVAKYLYEYAVLALPMTNTYDCENDPEPPCNREVLAYLNSEAGEKNSEGSVWDALKNLKNDN